MPNSFDWRRCLQNKDFWLVLAAGVGLLWVFGGDVRRALTSLGDRVRNVARDELPLETEIGHARDLVAALVPAIRQAREVVVREELDVEALQAEVEQAQQRLQVERNALLSVRNAVDSQHPDARQLRELQQRYALFQTNEATVSAKQEILATRERSLRQAEAQLAEMIGRRARLATEIDHLETRLKLLKSRDQFASPPQDDGNLVRCEEVLTYVRQRLRVAEGLADREERDQTGAASEPASSDILAEIDRRLGPATVSSTK